MRRYPNLDAELARRGLYQGQLAKSLGLTDSVISNKLNAKYGYRPFTTEEGLKICELLEMTPSKEVFEYLFKRGDV